MTEEAGVMVASVSRKEGINESTIRGWIRTRKSIEEAVESSKSKANKKTLSSNPMPSLTKMLMAYTDKVGKSRHLSLTGCAIRIQAQKYAKEILESESIIITAKEREKLKNFKASETWAKK